MIRSLVVLLLLAAASTLTAFLGSTPTPDGVISPGEYRDATPIEGVANWIPQFSPTTDAKDLSLKGWVKHDSERLYFAFDVTDDVLYGIDTPRWLPRENPRAHELDPTGYPWFGDGVQILMNVPNRASWQMVFNLTKSRLHGLGRAGLMEGEPRTDPAAWRTYAGWIADGAQQAVGQRKPGGKNRKHIEPSIKQKFYPVTRKSTK